MDQSIDLLGYARQEKTNLKRLLIILRRMTTR
jgi:hypothetical protein